MVIQLFCHGLYTQYIWLCDAIIKIQVNSFNHLIVKSEEERVILSFVTLSISDDLPNIPEEVPRQRA